MQKSTNHTPDHPQPTYDFNDPSMVMVLTRLSPPRLPTTLVIRERLLSTLSTVLSYPLTLLSASAGCGKTTLLSAWAKQHSQPVAWLSLDTLDNDPKRFWLSTLAALRHCWPTIGERTLTLLQTHASLSTAVTLLLNELAAISSANSPILLILDDFHVINEPSILASLTFAISHLSPHVHLLIASRIDPQIPLSRFRARGQVLEIRNTDLRFTQQEAHQFFNESMGLTLSDHDVQLLDARTEGWIASLQLIALFLQKHPNPTAGVQTLSGHQRFLLDYLLEEILASQPSTLQDFLLQTGGLNPLSASLCDAIRGKDDSAHLLAQIERANLFLQSLDEGRQWYRYHALWSEAMQYEAQRRLGPTAMRSLASNASLWYEQQRLLPQAIATALSCEDFTRTTTLIQQFVAPNSFRNEYHLLCSWLKHIPDDVLHAHPELCFLYSLALMFTTDRRSPTLWTRVESLLQWAIQRFQAQEQWEKCGDALQLYADLAFFQEDFTRMSMFSHQAQSLLTEHSLMYPENLLFQGFTALSAGELHLALQCFQDSYNRLKGLASLPSAFAVSLWLTKTYLEKGELHRAFRYSHQALADFAEDQTISQQQMLLETGHIEPFFTSWAYHSLAQLSYERNELTNAQHYLSQTQALREKPEAAIHVQSSGSCIQARLLHASGKTEQALDLLLQWEMHTRSPWSLRAIHACRARIQLFNGDLSSVVLWAQEQKHSTNTLSNEHPKNLSLLQQQEDALLLARLHIAQNQAQTALQELLPWKKQAQTQGRKRSLLEIHILEALAHSVCQQPHHAHSSLIQALRLAQPEQFQRLFIDEGPAMQRLLQTLLPKLRATSLHSYAHTLLQAFTQASPSLHPLDTQPTKEKSQLIEPLSEQEKRVLLLLSSGNSNQEIARELIISINTVKTHVRSLYRKLNVHNRVAACKVARHLSLL